MQNLGVAEAVIKCKNKLNGNNKCYFCYTYHNNNKLTMSPPLTGEGINNILKSMIRPVLNLNRR